MAKPVRLQLSRKRGFNLQALSLETNGLPAVNVARPSKWGNPAAIGSFFMVGDPDRKNAGLLAMSWCIATTEHAAANRAFEHVKDVATAVRLHEELAASGFYDKKIHELRGKNVACFCPLDQPCHGDTYLRLACEEIA